MLVIGTKLSPSAKRVVLARYIYRPTIENGYPTRNPGNLKVVPITDAEWLANHAFYVTLNGNLDARHKYCEPSYMADGNE